jgi:hypothetical protein
VQERDGTVTFGPLDILLAAYTGTLQRIPTGSHSGQI